MQLAMCNCRSIFLIATVIILHGVAALAEPGNRHYITNRAPLAGKPYTELPLGTIHPDGWLKAQLECMAAGMSGRLDELYPEVVGPREGRVDVPGAFAGHCGVVGAIGFEPTTSASRSGSGASERSATSRF